MSAAAPLHSLRDVRGSDTHASGGARRRCGQPAINQGFAGDRAERGRVEYARVADISVLCRDVSSSRGHGAVASAFRRKDPRTRRSSGSSRKPRAHTKKPWLPPSGGGTHERGDLPAQAGSHAHTQRSRGFRLQAEGPTSAEILRLKPEATRTHKEAVASAFRRKDPRTRRSSGSSRKPRANTEEPCPWQALRRDGVRYRDSASLRRG